MTDHPTGAARSTAGVLGAFFISGATSLVYQVVWTRWLGIVFGTTTTSISIVLGAFMCGLALGSALIGKRMARVGRPLRLYAWCEAGIGVFALSFPWLLQAVDTVYTTLDDGAGASGAVLVAKSVLSFALLCVPTGLMGATLPLLAEHFRRNPESVVVWRVGVLYAANTLGAAFGILAAGFVFIELIGISATTAIAALCNLLVAIVAWRISNREEPSEQEGAPSSQPEGRSPDLVWVAGGLAITGALALASEVLWARVLSSYLGTSTYAFSTIVCTYLVGIAAGSWLMARFVPRLRDLRLTFLAVVLAAGLLHSLGIEVFLVLATKADIPRGAPTAVTTILFFYLKFALLLLPIAMASGACFPLATRILNPASHDAEGSLVARAYAANTWGSVVGSLTAGFVIAAFLDFETSLRVVAGVYFGTVLIGGVVLRRLTPGAWKVAALALVAVVLTVGRGATRPSFVEQVESGSEHTVVKHTPGIQGLTTVLQMKDGEKTVPALFVNHHGMTVKVTDTKMMAHVPMFLHPEPESTLVICFGMGTTFRSALSHGGRATVVEIVPEVADSFELFHADAATIRANPKGRIVVGDGRHFLKATPERFDVITIDPPPPIDGEGVNHLYSQDFAALARSRLKPGGVVSHWVPFPGTMAGVDDMITMKMLLESFASAFPYTHVLVGYNKIGVHIIGSDAPIEVDGELMAERFRQRPAAVADLTEYDAVTPEAFLSGKPLAVEQPLDLVVTDDRPMLEFYLIRSLVRGQQKVLTEHLWLP